MSELKWANVYHHYIKAPMHAKDGKKIFKAIICDEGYAHCKKKPFVCGDTSWVAFATPLGKYTPVLRHLEDITRDEVIYLNDIIWKQEPIFGKKFVFTVDFTMVYSQQGLETVEGNKWWRICIESDDNTLCESLVMCTPAQFHWLISKGFDVFGLIESGQAIRKEVQP